MCVFASCSAHMLIYVCVFEMYLYNVYFMQQHVFVLVLLMVLLKILTTLIFILLFYDV